jgi:poly-beta-1,6-N-acetyl-D-glucosamine synthase
MISILSDLFNQFSYYLNNSMIFTLAFLPFLIIEAPIYISIVIGVIYYYWKVRNYIVDDNFTPSVTCIVPCYSEEAGALRCIKSLVNQDYKGNIQIIAIVDGSIKNKKTYDLLMNYWKQLNNPNRELIVIGKYERQGRVSSLNLGLYLSKYEIICVLDGDNRNSLDMVSIITQNYRDPNVVAGSGTLFPENQNASIVTMMQSIEYTLGICLGRTGLATLGTLNNISGGFGTFRRKILTEVGAWDAGTAEDLDLTIRLKQRIKLHPNEKLFFDPKAICYTDVPETIGIFFKQRLRWNGDLGYLYLRKKWRTFYYNLMGIKNGIYTAWYGVLHQIVCPLLIFIYTLFFAFTDTYRFVIVGAIVYLLYLSLNIMLYILYWTLLSTHKKNDLILVLFLPLFPVFTYISRLWDVVAHLNEAFRNGHLDSSMAPKHILKRSKF